ncbi:hypothetical protein F2Q70_00015105 [Brassica cretica]|uniref:Uncharacterized protein n=1 Tax=Brassica cretica TaxID=69181 RepID=A0A8S9I3V0_BRACR|nr:hypothetical protein F2Q70_00015105 [Brassica cretica]KAF2598348.1 hypothetical protein F2Q68_00008176 [Brassica cretica]
MMNPNSESGESPSEFINQGRFSGLLLSSSGSPRLGFSRSPSRLSSQDDLDDPDCSCPFDFDDVDQSGLHYSSISQSLPIGRKMTGHSGWNSGSDAEDSTAITTRRKHLHGVNVWGSERSFSLTKDKKYDSGRFSGLLLSSSVSPRLGFSRSPSRLSSQDDLDDPDCSCPFDFDDVDQSGLHYSQSLERRKTSSSMSQSLPIGRKMTGHSGCNSGSDTWRQCLGFREKFQCQSQSLN